MSPLFALFDSGVRIPRRKIMKKIWLPLNISITLIACIGLGLAWTKIQNLQHEIKTLKAIKSAPVKVIEKDMVDTGDFESRLKALERMLNNLSAQNIRESAETREKIGQLQKAVTDEFFKGIGINFTKEGEETPLTKEEIQEMVQAEIEKASERRIPFGGNRESITLNELADKIELFSDEKMKIQAILLATEEKIFKTVFGLENDAQWQELNAKIINSTNNPELKKELTQQVMDGFFENRSEIFSVFMKSRTATQGILGEKKHQQYRNYDVQVESQYTPAINILREYFFPGQGRRR